MNKKQKWYKPHTIHVYKYVYVEETDWLQYKSVLYIL